MIFYKKNTILLFYQSKLLLELDRNSQFNILYDENIKCITNGICN